MARNDFHTFLTSPMRSGQTWEQFCGWAGNYFRSDFYDSDVLANMARIKLWELWRDTDLDTTSLDFIRIASRSISNLLRDRSFRQKPDAKEGRTKKWRFQPVIRFEDFEDTGGSGIWRFMTVGDGQSSLDQVIFEESVARLRSLLDDPDAHRLFDYLYEGDHEIDEEVWIVAESKGQSRVRRNRYGRETMAEAFGWSVPRYRTAVRRLEKAAEEVFGS